MWHGIMSLNEGRCSFAFLASSVLSDGVAIMNTIVYYEYWDLQYKN